jgi:uncharacterized cupin superfamily protein
MRRNSEGVSESIGYLIIFGLVLSGIALITLYGYPLLMQQESSANLRNMEQTMIVLQNDIKSLTYKLANYKETTMRVSGGSLFFNNNVSTLQRFRIWSTDFPQTVPTTDFFPGELRYNADRDNTVITLENGAVIMKPLGTQGSVMLAEPRWYLDVDPDGKKSLIINYVSLGNATAKPGITNMSQTGVGNVRMSQKQTLVSSGYWPASNGEIHIQYCWYNNATIMPDGYRVAWKTFLTDRNNLNMVQELPPIEPDPYCYRFKMSDLKSIVVKEYDIMVETL